MTPVTQLSALDLLAELDRLEAEGGIDGAFAPDDQARWNAVKVELGRRVHCLDESTEDWRQQMVQAFAFSAGIAVTGLWRAFRGRALTDDESKKFATVMRDFFVTIK